MVTTPGGVRVVGEMSAWSMVNAPASLNLLSAARVTVTAPVALALASSLSSSWKFLTFRVRVLSPPAARLKLPEPATVPDFMSEPLKLRTSTWVWLRSTSAARLRSFRPVLASSKRPLARVAWPVSFGALSVPAIAP